MEGDQPGRYNATVQKEGNPIGYIEDLRQLIGHRRVILNGCCAVLVNEKTVLLQQRNEPEQRWGLPGGLMEFGETTQETVVREVAEESGLRLTPSQLTLLNVYSGDGVRTLPNGDRFDLVLTVYYAEHVTGIPQVMDAESLQYAWRPVSLLPTAMPRLHRQAIADYLALRRD